jgi:hypothetical protein
MLDWSTIQTGIVNALRDIPALVVLVGGITTNIFAYEDEYPVRVDVFSAIDQMQPPSVMVVWQGTEPGDFNDARPWKHKFSLILMPDGKIATMAKTIIDGVVTSSGSRFIEHLVVAAVDPSDTPLLQRQTVDIGDSTMQYYEISLSYTEWANQ